VEGKEDVENQDEEEEQRSVNLKEGGEQKEKGVKLEEKENKYLVFIYGCRNFRSSARITRIWLIPSGASGDDPAGTI
tara:strand:+ start:80 stop:310 length:231 start_codon:yes stop_codon:yes gene_type:complete